MRTMQTSPVSNAASSRPGLAKLTSVLACLCFGAVGSCTFQYKGDLPKPTAWRPIESPTGHGRLQLDDVRFHATGERTGVLTGVLTTAAVEVHAFETRTEPDIHRQTFLIFTNEQLARKETTRNHERVWKPVHPGRLVIHNPFGPSPVVNVDEQGRFTADLTFDAPHITTPPDYSDIARSLFAYTTPPAMVAVAPPVEDGVRYTPAAVQIPIWRFELDPEKAKAFAQRQTTHVEIRLADMLSRTPIAGRIRVTCVRAPTRPALRDRLARTFASSKAAEASMRFVPEYMTSSQVITSEGGVVAFRAAVGGAYRVETTNPAYMYFAKNITPTHTPSERKIILLPEKGRKVRIERVDDTLGGMVITDHR